MGSKTYNNNTQRIKSTNNTNNMDKKLVYILQKNKKDIHYEKPPSPSKCGCVMIATSVSQQLYEYLATLNADKQIRSLIQICNKYKMKSGDLLKTYCNNVERIILMFYKTKSGKFDISIANYSVDRNIAIFPNMKETFPIGYWDPIEET